MRLKITLDPEIPERILVPVLDITYNAIKVEEIRESNEKRFPKVAFRTEYTMDTDGFWTFAETIFWIIFCITLATVFFRIYKSANADRLETNQQADQTFLLFKVITISIEKFSNNLFWFMVAMSAWWFVFFKF